MEYTARLEDWQIDLYHRVIWGYCYGDQKQRFADGTFIHTSFIDAELLENAKSGDIVKTLNSSYLLGVPALRKR